MQIDQASWNTYWKDTIDKGIKKSNINYKPREDFTPEEVQKGKVDSMYGYQDITYHVIFDVNMDFTQKAILVANVSKTEAPVAIT